MYEELVKRLRNCTSDTVEDCAGCPYQGGFKGTYCMNGLISEAANVIEELSSHYCPHAIRNVHDRGDDSMCRVLMREVPKWIPVKERLPDRWTWVLICFDGAEIPSTGFINNAGDWIGEDMYTNYGVTHWMPLPQPPTECRQMVTGSNQVFGDSEQLDEPVSDSYKLEEET